VLTIDLRPPAGRYADPAARTRLYRRIVEELQRLPGVTAAGGAHRLPLDGNSAIPLVIEGRPRPPGDEVPSVTYRAVAGGYFQALDIPLRRGRFFSEAEAWQTGGAVIINQAAAERYFDGTDPLAQRLLAAGDRALQIVGVVENVKESALDQPAEPALYVPYAALPVPGMALVLRSASPPEGLIRAARTAIADVDPSLAPARARTLDAFLRTVIAQPRFNTLLLTLFAGIALAIAGVGVYGVTAYSVVQRTSEIGVRMALGARRFDIFKTIVAPGLTLAALGTALGIGGAVLLARFLGGTVFGVDARQPAVYAGTALLLFAVAAAATMLPARRAMLVDPVRSLRQE
jgi:predicted permease